ncbi:MAG: hypothetical protein ABI675_18070 [Chitinophagaceae bacterium]
MDNSTPGMTEMLIKYMDGELGGRERQELEQRLTSDTTLRSEYEEFLLAREAVGQYGLHQKVAGIHQQMMNELKTPVRKISKVTRIIRYSMAAAAGVLLLVAGIIVYNNSKLSPEKIFAANYRSYEISAMRGENEQLVSRLEKAYSEKKYAEVVNIVFDRPYSIHENFLIAMAWMELRNTQKAIDQYKIVIKEAGPANLLREEAEYYLALAYISNKQYSLALQQMEEIQKKPAHLYYSKITPTFISQVKKLNSQ